MKLPLSCTQCVLEGDHEPKLMPVDLENAGYVVAECPRGHRFSAVIQNHECELLFESGAYAFLDGYYREAVGSFAASMEKSYELYCRLVSVKVGMTTDQFDDAWKPINRSERQFGAFLFAYYMENKAPHRESRKSNKMREFRNGVIHEGCFPTKEETADYASWVLEGIESVFRPLQGQAGFDHSHQIVVCDLQSKGKRLREKHGASGGTFALVTMLSVGSVSSIGSGDFRQRIAQLAQDRTRLGLE